MAGQERESWWEWLKRKLTRRPRQAVPPERLGRLPESFEFRHHRHGISRPRDRLGSKDTRYSARSRSLKVSGASKSEERSDVQNVPEVSSVLLHPKCFDVIAEKTVLVTNEEQHIVWEEYGLRLRIPSNSLPENCSQFELKMAVGLSGDFELPDDGDLVSALYSFSHDLGDKEFRRPVTLEMQHCATPDVLDELCIVRASAGSNRFVVVPGGNFVAAKGYGRIELLTFSNFAIIFLRRHFPRFFSPYEYCCQVYTTSIAQSQFNFEVCIFRNLQSLSKVIEGQIKRRDGSYQCTGPPEEVQFHAIMIRLEIPEGSCGGWKMDCSRPMIDRNRVDSYTDRKVFFPSVIEVQWAGGSEQEPTQLSYKIKLDGAKEGFNFIKVKSPHSVPREPGGSSSNITPQDFASFPEPELAILMEVVGAQVAALWRAIGCGLGLKNNQLDLIEQSFKGPTAVQDCMRQVFSRWHDGGASEYSWKKLAEVLCSDPVEKQGLLPDIHTKLKEKYPPT